ncbi:MAG: sigma-70 family RNA polymerase sigma factor [Myxococcales bacterium]
MKAQRAPGRRSEQTKLVPLTELAVAAKHGDSRANAELWSRCTVMATRMARCWTGNGADVDDLSQEALLCALESFSELREPSALIGWLQVVLRRSMNRDVRSVRRKRPLMTGGSDPEVLEARDALPDVRVDLRLMMARLERMPEEERQCLWLRRAEGFRIEEIANETALSVSTIQRRLRVAERRLAKRWCG